MKREQYTLVFPNPVVNAKLRVREVGKEGRGADHEVGALGISPELVQLTEYYKYKLRPFILKRVAKTIIPRGNRSLARSLPMWEGGKETTAHCGKEVLLETAAL